MFSTDKRWKELGEVITNYCLEVQPGEKVMIAQYEIDSWPLALATYEATIKACMGAGNGDQKYAVGR
jgi:leucyl aminopeptidase (aminopeptidase T)